MHGMVAALAQQVLPLAQPVVELSFLRSQSRIDNAAPSHSLFHLNHLIQKIEDARTIREIRKQCLGQLSYEKILQAGAERE